MVDVSIGNETSPEANWNRQADRQAGGRTDGQTCVLGGCASKNWGKYQKTGTGALSDRSRNPQITFLWKAANGYI